MMMSLTSIDLGKLPLNAVLTEPEYKASIPAKNGPAAPPACIGSSSSGSSGEAMNLVGLEAAGAKPNKMLRDTTAPSRRKVWDD